MEQLEESWIMLDGSLIYFYIKRKKIKNMYMRFSSDGKLIITTPKSYKLELIERFIKEKKTWIFKQIKLQNEVNVFKEREDFKSGNNLYFLGKKYKLRLMAGNINLVNFCDEYIEINIKEKFISNTEYIKKFYDEWLRKECLEICLKYIEFYCDKMKKYKIPFPEVVIKKFKSRWGCCIPKKCRVEFAMNLVKAPKECVEYVVVHELTHFRFIHHDANFYNFVSLFIPDWKNRREILNKDYGRIIT